MLMKIVLGISRGKRIDRDPHPIGWTEVEVPADVDPKDVMVGVYQGLGIDPFQLVGYQFADVKLRVVYQEFSAERDEELPEITSADHFRELVGSRLKELS